MVRGRRLAIVGVLLLAFAIGESAIFLRAEVTRTAAYLFGDEAYSLFVADRLLHGARLYEDVAYPYGFLPVRLYAAVASVAGNSPVVYLQCLLAISLLNLALLITLLRRVAAPTVAIFIAFAAGLPLLLIPGALVGGYTGTPYIPIERALMLAIVLAWRPPATRSRTSAIALGVLIAALQTVKFGPALAMAAAVAIVDVVVTIRDRGRARLLLRAAALTFGAALAGELLLVLVTRATLSPEIAADVLWPSYLLQAYSGAARWPAWYGSRMFVAQYLGPLASGVMSLVALVMFCRHRTIDTAVAAIFILPVLFACGAAGLFRTEHHFRQAAWMLVPATAVLLQRRPPARVFAAVAWAPLLILLLCVPFRREEGFVALDLPNGWRLMTTPEIRARVESIAARLPREGAPVVLFPNASGLYVAYGLTPPGRDVWFYGAAVRPYEERAMAYAFGQARGLLVCDDHGRSFTSVDAMLRERLTAPLVQALTSRITERLWGDDVCAVFRLGEGTHHG